MIKSEWVDTLNKIKKYFPEAVIAGGALRDSYNGRDVKDVDIFVINRSTAKEDLDKAMGRPGVVLDDHLQEYEAGTTGVAAVYDYPHESKGNWDFTKMFESAEVVPFQVICIDYAEDRPFKEFLMEDFDIGLCRIYHDGQTLTLTSDFLTDIEKKTLTVFTSPTADNRTKQRTADRVDRLLSKYSDFAAKYPEGYWSEKTTAELDDDLGF